MDKEPKKCGYRSACEGREKPEYDVKLESVIKWNGCVCKSCLIAMQRLIYRNNVGTLEFKEFGSDTWRQYGSANDPSHEGKTDHMA